MSKRFIGPLILTLMSLFIILLWFKGGLLFAGAEEQLAFYNYSKSLALFSQAWYGAGTGYQILVTLSRIPYFFIFDIPFRLGISNILLEAFTFFILMLTGMLSVYFIIRETIAKEVKDEWKNWIPLLAAAFYFLNPFSMTQIWGRVLSYQLFSFALVPSFLLFFILTLQRRNLIFCLVAAILSFFLSSAYLSPSVVIASWAGIIIYLIFFLYRNRFNEKSIIFSLISFTLLLILWGSVNFFWIYPTIKHGGEMLTQNLTANNNIEIMRALSPISRLHDVIRLIHIGYNKGYGSTYNSIFFILLSWFLPFLALFSISTFKKTNHFLFFAFFLIISIIVSIGANFPTGWFLTWLFKHVPLLQVLRNPYEKFGINLVLAYSPFFAIGLLVFCEKLTKLCKSHKLKYLFVLMFIFLSCVLLVWPLWSGKFAGGNQINFWIKVPNYYLEANKWLNSQKGDFTILHLPLIPGDGITYTWEHPYEGIDPAEFLFDKPSISRNFDYNKRYYSVLQERFGATMDFKSLSNWSNDSEDFRDENLMKELAKLNVRFIILHFDTNYEARRAISPEQTRDFLNKQEGIKKVNQFEELEIYNVDIPKDINLIYSPQMKVDYEKVDNSIYLINIKNAKSAIDLYFLQQFHPAWKAFVGEKEIENHSEIFSYANSWRINKLGDYQVKIKFVQQDTVIFGTRFSFLTFGGLLIILIIYLIRFRKPFF